MTLTFVFKKTIVIFILILKFYLKNYKNKKLSMKNIIFHNII